MSNRLEHNKIASRYAKALFQSVQQGPDLEQVHQDLKIVSDLVAQIPQFNAFMQNPGVPATDKQSFVDEQFGKTTSPWVHRLLKLLVENNRMAIIPQLVSQFTEYRNQHENIATAEVITAVELEEELRIRIGKALETNLGFNRVDVSNRVDPGLLGGAIIKIHDKVIDGSYIGRLEELRKQIGKQ
jgi:F-type H+-transporting ATPase subunit delta